MWLLSGSIHHYLAAHWFFIFLHAAMGAPLDFKVAIRFEFTLDWLRLTLKSNAAN